MKLLTDLFSPHGKLDRQTFYFGLATISAITVLLRLRAETAFPGTPAQWAPVALGVWGISAMSLKRLRDMGASPRNLMLLLVGLGLYAAGAAARGGSTSNIKFDQPALSLQTAGDLLVILGALVVAAVGLWLMFTPSRRVD